MNTLEVLMVRIYITESSHMVKTIVNYLRHDASIRGVSVFRAVSGFGESGEHGGALLDLSLNLPLAIEFFDHKDKVMSALEYLNKTMKPEHIVFWEAKVNV